MQKRTEKVVNVKHIYKKVINDVINRIRRHFAAEGINEDVLHQLRQIWENKLDAAGVTATDSNCDNQTVTGTENEKEGEKDAEGKELNDKNNVNSPLQIMLPSQASNLEQNMITILVPQFALQQNYIYQILPGPIITPTTSLPPILAANVLQYHVEAASTSVQHDNKIKTPDSSNDSTLTAPEELTQESESGDNGNLTNQSDLSNRKEVRSDNKIIMASNGNQYTQLQNLEIKNATKPLKSEFEELTSKQSKYWIKPNEMDAYDDLGISKKRKIDMVD